MIRQTLMKTKKDPFPLPGNMNSFQRRCDFCPEKRKSMKGHPAKKVGSKAAPQMIGDILGYDFSKINVYSDLNNQQSAGNIANEFEDCPPKGIGDEQFRDMVNTAQKTAQFLVWNAALGLTHLPTAIPPSSIAMIDKHFHTHTRDNISKIVSNYSIIFSALMSPLDIECESQCKRIDMIAYVLRTPWSDLHLCPLWHKIDPSARATTIIHELGHLEAGLSDHAYFDLGDQQTGGSAENYNGLTPEKAMKNADSYARFAQDAYYGVLT